MVYSTNETDDQLMNELRELINKTDALFIPFEDDWPKLKQLLDAIDSDDPCENTTVSSL